MKRFAFLLAFACLSPAVCQAADHTITIHEPFGLAWGPDRINEPKEG